MPSLRGDRLAFGAPGNQPKIGVSYADVEIAQKPDGSRNPIHFTFWWNDSGTWADKDFHVGVV